MGTNLLNPFEIFAPTTKRAGVFDIDAYGSITRNASAYELQDFQYEIEFKRNAQGSGGFETLFSINNNSGASNFSGWRLVLVKATGEPLVFFAESSSVRLLKGFGSNVGVGVKTKLKVEKFNGSYLLYQNDNLEETDTIANVFYNDTEPVLQGINFNDLANDQECDAFISLSTFNSLDSSGDIVDNLIDLDFENGDTNTITNIATDAPASSDMTWVPAGSGTYENI